MAFTKMKLRGAYFALCKGHGMTEDDRHAWNLSRIGKSSTRAWSYQDWKDAVSQLQILAGQNTDRQCEMVEDLCDRIAWRLDREHGPRAYVVGHFLQNESYALIKARLGEASGRERWKVLPRLVARDLIIALKKMTRAYPLEETVAR